MATSPSTFRQRFSRAPRYQRLCSYALVAYTLYALLLGLLVPYLAKSIAPEKLSALLGRPVQIQDVSVNPFTLKFEVKGFAIQTPEQEDFTGVGRLTLQVNLWKSLFNGSINIETIEIDNAFAKIEKLDATQFNFSDIPEHMATQAALAEAAEPVTEEPINEESADSSQLPHIQIANISITNTAFNFKDQPTGTELDYPAINFILTKFNSIAMLENKQQDNAPTPTYNSFDLSIEGSDESAVTTAGRFQLTPLEAQGELALKHIKLTTFWPFIAKEIIAELESGVIDLATNYRFIADITPDAETPTPQLITDTGEFALRSLVFTSADNELINLPLLTAAGIALDLEKQLVGIDNVSTDGLQLHASINKGEVDLATLLTPASVTSEPTLSVVAAVPVESKQTTAEQDSVVSSVVDVIETVSEIEVESVVEQVAAIEARSDARVWVVNLGEFNLTNYDINIVDSWITKATKWRIAPLNFSTNAISSSYDAPIDYELALSINDNGSFTSKGSVDIKQQSIDAYLSLEKLNLTQFQPYITPYLNITIDSGYFNTKGDLFADSQGTARFSGEVQVETLAIHDNKLNKSLLKWQDFTINSIALDQQKNSLLIDHIKLTRPYAQVIVAADKSSNISDLVIEQKSSEDTKELADEVTATDSKPAENKEPAADMLIELNKFTLLAGKVDYTDNVLKPSFEATIDKIEGHIGKISSTTTKNAEIDMQAIVNKYAPMTLKGVVNPLIPEPFIDVEFVFNNFELPSMTPYSGTYAGLDIDEGQLSLALKYKLENNRLEGSNDILIDQLDMNNTKDSDVGSILPVTLAIPLLKDSSGAIDLGVNVSGDINDPSFNVGEIVLKSLSNIILKAVTSPFTLLASLVDTTEDLDKVSFANGSAILPLTEQGKLNTLAKALAKRPDIKLNIKGSYDSNLDKQSLQNSSLNDKLTKSSGIVISPETNETTLPESAKVSSSLVSLYELETKGNADSLRTAIATQQPALAKTELEQVWLRSLYTETSKLQTVTDKQLKRLAKNRADAIKTHLRDVSKVESGRVFVLSHQTNVPSTSTETTLTMVVK
ncbi:DUF748 domain-containing protein [Moritella sp. F3]|uniref:DUF748 domain-containing protein n=1 Tax=Moritella sp. F3 TaxID=2718882 RepID=UPI0018E14BA1|nr:DUF748 domain-containing protein [Moritella sp. F3]GIC77495.1 hypothetical protein FMO001_22220 [Moritella sp. F1]GIC79956.1 hypothetical protein FMO003_02370 [Moritella sp. F3]